MKYIFSLFTATVTLHVTTLAHAEMHPRVLNLAELTDQLSRAVVSRALDEAGEYSRDTHRGRMVHLFGLMPVFMAGETEPAAMGDGDLDVHAGTGETSNLLFVRADLVAPSHETAASLTGRILFALPRHQTGPGT